MCSCPPSFPLKFILPSPLPPISALDVYPSEMLKSLNFYYCVIVFHIQL